MIEIKCKAPDTIRLADLVQFQGGLKKRTAKDIEALKFSLETEGLLMPFAVWKHDDKALLLDGHGRYQALSAIALNDVSIIEQDFPVLIIDVATEDEARKALLQISSTYGKITTKGLQVFTAPIVGYKCPATIKLDRSPVQRVTSTESDVIIRLKVRREKAEELLAILKKVDGVTLY